MVNWYCDSSCKVSRGGAGPWDDKTECFPNIKHAHKDCPSFQTGEPRLKGKSNWGHTEIEKKFTNAFNKEIDQLFHKVISSSKGSDKVCLIKNNGENLR